MNPGALAKVIQLVIGCEGVSIQEARTFVSLVNRTLSYRLIPRMVA